jgi:hypothetical protein
MIEREERRIIAMIEIEETTARKETANKVTARATVRAGEEVMSIEIMLPSIRRSSPLLLSSVSLLDLFSTRLIALLVISEVTLDH